MKWMTERFEFLFRSTRGLVLVAIALISLVTVMFGMLSGPMDELGVKDVIVRALGYDLNPAEREGRIIILYLSLIHISEPTRLLSISYAVFCLKKKNKKNI